MRGIIWKRATKQHHDCRFKKHFNWLMPPLGEMLEILLLFMEMQVTTFNYPTEVFAICASEATLYTSLHIISIWLHIPNHLRRELQMEPKLLSVSEVIVHPNHPLTR